MENVNDALLNRERKDAAQMRQEQVEARGGDSEARVGVGGTIEQMKRSARNFAKKPMPGTPGGSAAGASSSPMAKGTSKLLRQAWINMFDPFAIPLALIYINTHLFGHSVFGEKVFGELGEELLPEHLRTNLESPEAKAIIKKIGLLEKCVLILLDSIALLLLLIVIGGIIFLITYIANWLNVAKAIPGLSWDWLTGLFSGSSQ
jgi:hypothetical protein